MKILHVIDSGGLYGAEVMLLHLIAEQERLGLEPVIASIGDRHCGAKPLELEAARRGIRVETFRMRPGPNLLGALELARFARREGVDLFHSHGYKGDILLGTLPRALRPMPAVATIHGRTSQGKLGKLLLYEWADSLSLHFLDAVVVVHEAMRGSVRHRNLRVVPNGIGPGMEEGRAPSETGEASLDRGVVEFCSQGFVIGAIGRLSREKGFGYLVQALAQAQASYPDCRLVILGEGDQREALEAEAARLGVTGALLLPGYRENASRYLPHFDAFALPSLTEGLPMVLLEAMRGRVPIVASPVGGVPSLLCNGEAGLLVGPRDAAGLAQGLIRLREEPRLRFRLVEQAARAVSERFSSGQMARAYREIYREVLEAPAAAGLRKPTVTF